MNGVWELCSLLVDLVRWTLHAPTGLAYSAAISLICCDFSVEFGY